MKTGLYWTALEKMERALFAAVLDDCDGNQVQAAQRLGVNRGMLRTRLLTYGLLDRPSPTVRLINELTETHT